MIVDIDAQIQHMFYCIQESNRIGRLHPALGSSIIATLVTMWKGPEYALLWK